MTPEELQYYADGITGLGSPEIIMPTRKSWSLADELRSTKKALAKERQKSTELERALSVARLQASCGNAEYPAVSMTFVDPSAHGKSLPPSSGIYFLWEGDIVKYVGQSVRLNNRLRLGHHHILSAHHRISFVPIEVRMLDWAECHYIGLLRPSLNFGRRNG